MAYTAANLITIAGTTGTLLGNPLQPIYDVRPYAEEDIDANTLFVAAQDWIISAECKAPVYKVLPEQVPSVLRKLHNQIVRDYRRKGAMARLLDHNTDALDINDLAALLQEVMENPIWILNAQQEVVAFSGEIAKQVDLQDLNRHFSNTADSAVSFAEPDAKCCYRRAVGRIYQGRSLTGYLVVIESSNPLLDSVDIQYVQQLCLLLSRVSRLPEHTQITADEWLVQNLLRGQLSKPEIIEERMRQIKWKRHEKTHILAIDIQTASNEQRKYLPWRISSILNCKLYPYQHYLIAILGCPHSTIISEYSYPELLKILTEENLFAGLSNGFLDYSLFKAYFDQCVAAIHHRVRFLSLHPEVVRFARFEDVELIDLIGKAEQQGIPPITLCHPVILRIIEYDRLNNTEYLNTLENMGLKLVDRRNHPDLLDKIQITLFCKIGNADGPELPFLISVFQSLVHFTALLIGHMNQHQIQIICLEVFQRNIHRFLGKGIAPADLIHF